MKLHLKALAALSIVGLSVAFLIHRGKGSSLSLGNEMESKSAEVPVKKTRPTFESICQPLVLTRAELIKTEGSLARAAEFGAKTAFSATISNPLLTAFGAEIIKKYFGSKDNGNEELQLGTLKVSAGVVGVIQEGGGTNYELWRLSLPVVIEPASGDLGKTADDFSSVKLRFRLVDERGEASAQVLDVLPNTKFDVAQYGADAQIGIKVGAERQFGVVKGEGMGSFGFWWKWEPQIRVVTSGAAGNEAFCLLKRKPDGTNWIGRVPIELLVMAPKNSSSYTLHIEPAIEFRERLTIKLPQSQVRTRVLLEH